MPMASFFDGMPTREPSGLVGFAGNRIERRSEHRDSDAVAAAFGDAGARFYLFHADKVLLHHGDPLFSTGEAHALGAVRDEVLLLGWTGDGPRLAAMISEPMAIDETTITAIDLRSLATAGELSAEHLGALAQARSLANWHLRHRFCAN